MALALAIIVGDLIVVCADEGPFTEHDAEISRDFALPHGFRALIAATPSVAEGLASELALAFDKLGAGFELDVKQAAYSGLRAFKQRSIDAHFESHFGQTYGEFVGSRNLIPQSTYDAEIEKARNTQFNAELMIIGFVQGDGGDTEPVILASHPDWSISTYAGFRAIGEGELAADYQLRARGLLDGGLRSVDEAIYLAFEAKRIAEISENVGSHTKLTVYSQEGGPKQIDAQGQAELSTLFASYGPRPLSKGISIASYLQTQGT